MATWQQFALDSVQAAMFTPDHAAFAAGRAVAIVLRQFGQQFDGEMQALPLPGDVPPEIPRVTLQSSDGRRRLNLGPARLDLIWSRSDVAEQANLGDVATSCSQVLEHYARESQSRMGRLALVVRRVCAEENPAQALIQRFCNDQSRREPFNRSATFEIHNHKEYSPRREGIDYAINSWVRCRSGAIEPEKRPAILVIQDMNTMASELEQRRFEKDQIRDFFQMAAEEADQIICKYFPE